MDNAINDEVQKSLREIATLLLLVHEQYVQDPDNSYNVFNSLRLFVYDIGLKDIISSLDIEKYRRKVMRSDDSSMNYEKFYDWLRGIASLAFEGGGKRALHSLLTMHIIPLASKGVVGAIDPTISNTSQMISLKYVSNVFDVLLRYSDFLHLWYILIISDAPKRVTPINSLWQHIIKNTKSVSISKLTQNFATCGIYPGIVSPSQLKQFIQSIETNSSKLKEELTAITFDGFLAILEMIAKHMGAAELLSSNPFDHDSIISKQLIKLFIMVSGYFLKSTLYKFWVQDHNQSSSLSLDVTSSTRCLGQASIAWLLRQSGLTQVKKENIDLLWLAEIIEYHSNKSTEGIQLVKLPNVLYNIFKDTSLIPHYIEFDLKGKVDDLEEICSQIAIIFAEYCAAVLYATPLRVPSLLEGLYNSFKSKEVETYTCQTNSIYNSIAVAQSIVMPDTDKLTVFPSLIVHYCESMKIIPNTLSTSLVLKTCEHTLGRDIDSVSVIRASLTKADLSELLFVLAQIVFGNDTDVNEDPMNKFIKLLNLFDDRTSSEILIEENLPSTGETLNVSTESENGKSVALLDDVESPLLQKEEEIMTEKNENSNSNLSTGSSFRDIIILLIHYPMNSFNHNPWQVVQMFKDSSKIAISEGGPKNSLPHLFRLYCSQFNLLPETLGSFFSSFYKTNSDGIDNKNISIRDSVRIALNSQVFDCLLNNYSLRLLYANSELLKWEFSRWSARFRSTDPFTCYERTPLITTEMIQSRGRDAMMTSTSATEWAVQIVGLTRDQALINLESSAVLMSNPNRYLTFAAFVIYAIKCFSYRIIEEKGTLTSEEFVIVLKKMLQTFSERLTAIQQTMHMRVVKVVVGNLNDPVREFLELGDRLSLIKCAMNIYIDNYISKFTTGGRLIPPRPPSSFWDAPRFIDFCKNCSVILRTNSLLFSWQAFGLHLATLQLKVSTWGPDVVAPLPVQAEASVLLTLLEKTLAIANKKKEIVSTFCQDNSSTSLQKTLVQDILPWAVSCLDLPSDNDASSTKSYVLLEDIIRYGGENAMISIDLNGSWLRSLYDSLAASQPDVLEKKLQLPVICKLLSCQGLLRNSVVALQARQARHCRLRSLVHNLASVAEHAAVTSLEFPEFEEIVIRCAYVAWEISNVTVNSFADPSIFMNVIEDHSPHIIETIREYCVLSSDIANKKTKQSWGVDFLTPYLAALKTCQMVKNLSIKSYIPEQTKLNVLDAHFEIRNSPITTAEMARPSTPQAPEPIRELVETPAVIARSSELLSDILADRLNYSIADPLTRNLNSVNLLASNSLEDINVQVVDFETNIYNDTVNKNSTSSLNKPENPSRSSPMEVSMRPINAKGFRKVDSEGIKKPSYRTKNTATEVVRAIDKHLYGTKEALWPVYATYCSCGDSTDPGKLSGPNLFTLLSKLGVLSDKTVLSDVGILLHQISANTNANSPIALTTVVDEICESPSLSFEEFLVFLCAFSQLVYEGIVDPPIFDICKGNIKKRTESLGSDISDSTFKSEIEDESWSDSWEQYMGKSSSFKKLLEETILPLLHKYPLLAFPEDARQRDIYSPVFSLEVLLAVQSAEGILVPVFEKDRMSRTSSAINDETEMTSLITALKRIKLIPQIIAESHVMRLVKDVMPEKKSQSPKVKNGKHLTFDSINKIGLLFPQWEYVLCVVANHAVDIAVRESPQYTDPLKIPSLIADVITSISTAMKSI